MKKKKIILFFVLFIFIAFTGPAVRLFNKFKKIGKIETKENVSDPNQLPSWVSVPNSAKNISYCNQFWIQADYEFDISEEEFLKWAQEWPVQKITEPISYMTFRRCTLPSPDHDDVNAFEEYDSKVYLKIHNGYYYEKILTNGGGTRVAYDKDKQRAYYSFSFR